MATLYSRDVDVSDSYENMFVSVGAYIANEDAGGEPICPPRKGITVRDDFSGCDWDLRIDECAKLIATLQEAMLKARTA